jgi:hypothetical protein
LRTERTTLSKAVPSLTRLSRASVWTRPPIPPMVGGFLVRPVTVSRGEAEAAPPVTPPMKGTLPVSPLMIGRLPVRPVGLERGVAAPPTTGRFFVSPVTASKVTPKQHLH